MAAAGTQLTIKSLQAGTSVASAKKQGTVISSKVDPADATKGLIQLVTITPNEYNLGDTVEIDDADYPISSIVKPTTKVNSGKSIVQKETNITIPEQGSAGPTNKKTSFLIVKSF